MARHFFGLLFFFAVTASQTFVADALIIDHHHTNTQLIPDAMITQAKNTLHIAYQHTSHGSQIITGMGALRAYPSFGSKYDFDDAGVRAGALDLDDNGIPGGSSDLSTGDYLDVNGVTPWVTATRNLLNNTANNHINVIVWSWCSINGHDIPRYLTNMEILVAEYGPGGTKPRAAAHPVTFVFMTGHAEGQGEGGNVHAANQQIRQHCLTNGRVLFDFADIESYNPDGEYFYARYMYDNLDYGTAANSTGNWGAEWIASHTGSELERLTTGNGVGGGYTGCSGCAHSDDPAEANINCVLKGRAFWWLLAAITGWTGDLNVTPSNQAVSKDAGTTTFSVSNTGTGTMPWTAEVISGGGWLSITTITSGSAGTITCSYSANTSTSSRTAIIRVTATGATGSPKEVTVTQASTPTPSLDVSTLLWTASDGTALIWAMDAGGNKTGEMYYGPYTDWNAKTYHRNSDGTAQMLWVRTDGYVSLWATMDISGNPTSKMKYGPYTGWTANGYHRNSDGTGNMLLVRTDGYTSLWTLDAGGNKTSERLYGPYEGWTAKCYHGNSDGTSNMLWVRTDGYVSLWTMDTGGNPISKMKYGPYEGWTAKSYYRNSDGTGRMLWVRTDGYVSLWNMDVSGNPISKMKYGPYEGWNAQDFD